MLCHIIKRCLNSYCKPRVHYLIILFSPLPSSPHLPRNYRIIFGDTLFRKHLYDKHVVTLVMSRTIAVLYDSMYFSNFTRVNLIPKM